MRGLIDDLVGRVGWVRGQRERGRERERVCVAVRSRISIAAFILVWWNAVLLRLTAAIGVMIIIIKPAKQQSHFLLSAVSSL